MWPFCGRITRLVRLSVCFSVRPSVSIVQYCFKLSLFLCQHVNSMKFCMNMYLHNLQKLIEYQGHRSKIKVMFLCVFVCPVVST